MDINRPVHAIRQPHLTDCWATCSAMLIGLDGLRGVSEIKRRAAGIPLNGNGSLRPSSVAALAQRLGLNIVNLRTPARLLSVDVLTRVLGQSAAAAFGEYNYPGAPRATMHVFLFFRLSGSDSNPMIHFIDPYRGRAYNYLMDEFNESLGSVDYFLYR